MILAEGFLADTTAPDPSAAFDLRFAAERERLTAVCINLAGRDNAADLVQDTYIRGRAAFPALRDPDAFSGWLIRIAINLCRSTQRRDAAQVARLQAMGREEPAPASDAGLRELIEQLNPRDRTVLVLHYGYGYGLREIGDLMALSHTNVRSICMRARRRLAEAWTEASR